MKKLLLALYVACSSFVLVNKPVSAQSSLSTSTDAELIALLCASPVSSVSPAVPDTLDVVVPAAEVNDSLLLQDVGAAVVADVVAANGGKDIIPGISNTCTGVFSGVLLGLLYHIFHMRRLRKQGRINSRGSGI